MKKVKVAVPDSDGYIPPNTVYASTTTCTAKRTRFDFTFIGTRLGLLKMLQQIFILLGSATYAWGVSKSFHLVSKPMITGFFLYSILLSILLPVVHVLMWFYILHKVEIFSQYPWYTIEFIICGVGGAFCFLTAFCPLYTFLSSLQGVLCFSLIFTLVPAFLFIYNIFLVHQRRKKEIPLQGSKFSTSISNSI